MYPLGSAFIGVFLTLLSRSTAIPTYPVVKETLGCLVPALGLSSILSPFTLSVITDKDPTPWTVVFSEVRTKDGYQPFITRAIIAEPIFVAAFNFQNGKLTVGPANNNLTGYFGPSPSVLPPAVYALYFDDVRNDGKFYAVYNCDGDGKTYLELRTYYSKDSLFLYFV